MASGDQKYEILIETITAASQFPFVKVKREEFLRKEFSDSPYIDKIIKDGWATERFYQSSFTQESSESHCKCDK